MHALFQAELLLASVCRVCAEVWAVGVPSWDVERLQLITKRLLVILAIYIAL